MWTEIEVHQSVLPASLVVGSFSQWVFLRRFLAFSELGENEPFQFLGKFAFTILSSQPYYLHCPSGTETRAEWVGSGDVTLEEQEGQRSLSSLEANTGLGGCKLP